MCTIFMLTIRLNVNKDETEDKPLRCKHVYFRNRKCVTYIHVLYYEMEWWKLSDKWAQIKKEEKRKKISD